MLKIPTFTRTFRYLLYLLFVNLSSVLETVTKYNYIISLCGSSASKYLELCRNEQESLAIADNPVRHHTVYLRTEASKCIIIDIVSRP